LGAPVEFMTRAEILDRFGAGGITDFAPAYGALGSITDDTQMTLFTAEGLLCAWLQDGGSITSCRSATAQAYLRWLRTQAEEPAIEMAELDSGWLFRQRALHNRRGPGNTCLSALLAMESPGEFAHNDSKGCGGVMRSAPVGLFAWQPGPAQSSQHAFDLGAELTALTHGHPTGSLASGAAAVLVMMLADGAALSEAIAMAKAILREQPNHEETLRAIELAETYAAGNADHPIAIARLGRGWVAEEALAISVYCALVAADFRDGVILAVNHDGDSDSTGAIAGNLLGAIHGVDAIPAEWLGRLELREVITEVAEDLLACRQPGGSSERMREKYLAA
jgi:ADP-ribosylglycohydrolase